MFVQSNNWNVHMNVLHSKYEWTLYKWKLKTLCKENSVKHASSGIITDIIG